MPRSQPSGLPPRPSRARLGGSVLALVLLPNGRQLRARMHQLSITGGVLHVTQPLDEGVVVEIAFHADSRSMVDRFYKQHLLHRKIPVLYGGPKEYPWYSKGYYSVYFENPDRTKLELAYVPEFRKPIATGKDKGALRAPRPSGQS